MFKNLIFLATAFLSLSAFASEEGGIDPCTPSYVYQSQHMGCKVGNIYYSIEIFPKGSPNIPACRGNKYQEIAHAQLSIMTAQGPTVDVTLPAGSFSYSTGINSGDSKLSVPLLQLNLLDCVIPMNGGFSAGN